MSGGGAELQGADVLVRTLQTAADELDDLSAAERAAGQLLAGQGAQAAPRRSGLLADRHGYVVVDDRLTVTAATDYAAIVHAHNPWLTRTVDRVEGDVLDIYMTGVDAALSNVKGTR